MTHETIIPPSVTFVRCLSSFEDSSLLSVYISELFQPRVLAGWSEEFVPMFKRSYCAVQLKRANQYLSTCSFRSFEMNDISTVIGKKGPSRYKDLS